MKNVIFCLTRSITLLYTNGNEGLTRMTKLKKNQWSSKSKFLVSREVLCSRILYWRVEVAWNARLTTTQNSMLKLVFRTLFNKEVRAARTIGGL